VTAPDKPVRDKRFISLLWATIDHADALAKCHASLFPDAWNADSFRQMLSHPGSATLVARYGVEQELVGFIVGQLAADEAEILTFGVTQDWQRNGIGMRLLEGLQRAASRGEAKKLFLEVIISRHSCSIVALALKRPGAAKGTTSGQMGQRSMRST
jgi:[ribosomal protein S18]-alanine N-acetyltransferase